MDQSKFEIKLKDIGTCISCKGHGKNLVRILDNMCQRCKIQQQQDEISDKATKDKQFELLTKNYISFGPCLSCKGYGKNLCNLLSFCQRCYTTEMKNIKSLKEKGTEEQPYQSKLLEIINQQREYGKMMGIQDQFDSAQTIQEQDKVLSKAIELKQLRKQNLSKVLQKNKIQQAQQNKKNELTEEEIEILHKRKIEQLLGNQQKQFKKNKDNSNFDPMDPSIYNPDVENKLDNIMSSLHKAADETAEGPKFQARPYLNPGKALEMMRKKNKMF